MNKQLWENISLWEGVQVLKVQYIMNKQLWENISLWEGVQVLKGNSIWTIALREYFTLGGCAGPESPNSKHIACFFSDGSQEAVPKWWTQWKKDSEKTSQRFKRHTSFIGVLSQGDQGTDQKVYSRADAGMFGRNTPLSGMTEKAWLAQDGAVDEFHRKEARSQPCHCQQMDDWEGDWPRKSARGCTKRQSIVCRWVSSDMVTLEWVGCNFYHLCMHACWLNIFFSWWAIVSWHNLQIPVEWVSPNYQSCLWIGIPICTSE